MTAPFERTACACRACVDCCKSQPGPLGPGQLEAIAAHLGKTLDEVKPDFVASPGAVVGDRSGRVWRVGTITPRAVNGRCVFLDEQERCRIHAVAPHGCALYDTHMSREAAQAVSRWLIGEQAESESYQALRETLAPATSWKPTGF